MKTNFSISTCHSFLKFCKDFKIPSIQECHHVYNRGVTYIRRSTTSICKTFLCLKVYLLMRNVIKNKINFKVYHLLVLVICIIFSLENMHAQNYTEQPKLNNKVVIQDNLLRGVITDESGPLAGANILLKHSKTGVTADFDGKFKFPVVLKEGDILLISYLGYETQQIKILKNQKFLNVKLTASDIDLLGDVNTNKIYSSKGK